MRKIKCDNINVKILLNQIDVLQRENERLKNELRQMHIETHAFNTVTVPLLKNRIEFFDEERRKEVNKLKQKLGTAVKETAERFASKLRCEYIDFGDCDEISVGYLREDISKICKEIAEGEV